MDSWWLFPLMGFWMVGYWLIFLGLAYLVYRDADSRGMNAPFWAVLMVIPWLGMISLMVYLIIRVDRPGFAALEILDERYAKGEITREQLEQMRLDLQRGSK
ncbi:MAG TPA: SHOCT domain-containing protein [Methanotrichaceae archaeon]|nr:SHOCT domain-containing protein [Methanotrichaceae archaeon]HQF15637.1 SHOCT domain-containing protein [Methanotrichaceae archaeon]HQI90373.1 SHOCT domain-containing protein [Methanotrichaceae archaeon]HQJ28617.1 SHOCT domain-containing protein [Methanotrichaceae archaeon]